MMQYADSKTLRVFISGTTPYADNRGVAAIFRGTLEVLRSFNCRKFKIYVWHTIPESVHRYHKGVATACLTFNNMDIEVIPHRMSSGGSARNYITFFFKLIYLFSAMVLQHFFRLLGSNIQLNVEILREIMASDFIIELNFGDSFTDTYYGKIVWILNVLRASLLNFSKKSLYMFPQSIGPFRSPLSRVLARIILKNAKIIAVRESYSYAHVVSLGIDKNRIWLVPDMGFLCSVVPTNQALKILHKEGLNRKYHGKLFGIMLNPFILTFRDGRDRSKFLQELIDAIDGLIEKFDAIVVFIPHYTSIDSYFDCRKFSLLVRRALRNKNSLIIMKEYTVEELWGVIRVCDVTISMLTHPVIASLKLGVPVIAIGYSHKTWGAMKLFGIERYTLPHENFNSNEIIKTLEDVIENNDRLKLMLEDRMCAVNRLLRKFRKEFWKKVA